MMVQWCVCFICATAEKGGEEDQGREWWSVKKEGGWKTRKNFLQRPLEWMVRTW